MPRMTSCSIGSASDLWPAGVNGRRNAAHGPGSYGNTLLTFARFNSVRTSVDLWPWPERSCSSLRIIKDVIDVVGLVAGDKTTQSFMPKKY